MVLDEDVVRLAKGPNLATVVTLMPSGQPQAQLTWVDTDGEYILINTEPTRQRVKNLSRDPRITVLIYNAESAWDWAEIRGSVADIVGGQPACEHIDELSQKYFGINFQHPIGPQGRIIIKVEARKVNTAKSLAAQATAPGAAQANRPNGGTTSSDSIL